jgi:hypothetical protein
MSWHGNENCSQQAAGCDDDVARGSVGSLLINLEQLEQLQSGVRATLNCRLFKWLTRLPGHCGGKISYFIYFFVFRAKEQYIPS